jgi:DNA-binding MarR family transcriptional regulator
VADEKSHRSTDSPPSKEEALPGDKAPSSLGFLLSVVGIYASRRFAERIAALDLHPPMFRVLNVVDAAEGQPQHAIAAAIQAPPSRMVAIIDELEQRKLVERRPNPGDRRVHAVYLTAEGRKLLEKGRKIATEHEEELTRGMSDAERERLVNLLRKLVENQGIGPGVHPGLSDRK